MRDYKCRNCGALLNIEPGTYFVKCEYCDTVIDLERSIEQVSSEAAQKCAEKIREYRNTQQKVKDAWLDIGIKAALWNEKKEKLEKVNSEVYTKYALSWFFSVFAFCILMLILLHDIMFFMASVDLAFAIGIGCAFFSLAKKAKERKMKEADSEVSQAYLQKKYAEDSYAELWKSFDVDFIPEHVRSDEALSFMIKALESEKAYTLRQAVSQWEDRTELQTHTYYEENTCGNNETESKNSKSVKDAEVIGAFAGAAAGALGGAVLKKVAKEVIKHL